MMQGTIKKLTDKNFGFITTSDSDKDLFFHANELVDVRFEDLREGDAVNFEVSDTPKGPAATKVSKA
ncbi:cold shock domain-containing protein [Candidatus Parcubacteria bacterium]|nr:MAG: cold shock domain-containing protein [Candidatus Parcubacteria bacterium]